MKRFTQLARKHNKQVIMTTHSPSVLDGLNIDNDDERLFVVRRNIDGHTKVNRVKYNNDQTDMPLSEAWVNGYLGGLPENF
jgi:predicted ATP-dependent endonuclease of OLD family